MWLILNFFFFLSSCVLLKMGRKRQNVYLSDKMVWVLNACRANVSNLVAFLQPKVNVPLLDWGILYHRHKGFVLSFAVPCPVGEFSRSGLMPCYPCPRDYYQPNPGKSFCLSCPFYGTTTITGARSITDCSSKMISFISYVILGWRLLLICVVASILNITIFSACGCLDVLKCPFEVFLMTVTQRFSFWQCWAL